MKQIDFIHKYKHHLPYQYRKDFERDLLSIFIDDDTVKSVLWDEVLTSGYFDHFKTIMDIECKPLKEKE
jgi:hypothetical protein